MKPLSIIGLDPGTTTACAVLDLTGKVINLFSSKELPLSKIIEKVVMVSLPVITSTDKAKVPALVEEFSRKMGTKLVTPPTDLLREEKRKLIAEKEMKIAENGHEHDALAAALYAYQELLPRLQKIERFILENGLSKLKSEFTLLAMREDELNFNLIKDILTKPTEENKAIQKVLQEEQLTKRDFMRLFDKLKTEQTKNKFLVQNIGELNHRLNKIERENKKLGKSKNNFDQRVDTLLMFKEARIKQFDHELKQVNELVTKLNNKVMNLFGFIGNSTKFQVLKKLDSLSKEEFERKNDILAINDKDILLVADTSVFSEQIISKLKNKDVVIVSTQKLGKFITDKFPTAKLSAEEIVEENEYFALVALAVIQEKLSRGDVLGKVVEEYREERKREK
jgi:predicted RNase H-like nuclease (RuvC/YqgF family)